MKQTGARAWIATGLLLCSSLTAACAVILGFDPLVEGTEQPPDAQDNPPDAYVDAGMDAAPVCLPKTPRPPRSTGIRTSRFFALQSLRFRPVDGGSPPGLDLDCLDTREPDPKSSCQLTAVSEALDFGNGVDNASSRVLDLAERSIDFEAFDRRVKAGDVGMTFRMVGDFAAGGSGMNVDAYPARGLHVFPLPSCSMRDAGEDVPATADAARIPDYLDKWCTDRRFQAMGSDLSTIRSTEAWLDGDRFVAHFPSLEIPLLGRGADGNRETDDPVAYVSLQNAWLTARLDRGDGGRWSLREGVLGGRWRIADILSLNATAVDQACGIDPVVLASLGSTLCGYRDITVASDRPESEPCDSLSMGVAFDAYELEDDGDFASVTVAEDPCFADAAAEAAEAGRELYTCSDGGTAP